MMLDSHSSITIVEGGVVGSGDAVVKLMFALMLQSYCSDESCGPSSSFFRFFTPLEDVRLDLDCHLSVLFSKQQFTALWPSTQINCLW